MKTCHFNALSLVLLAGLTLTPIAGICADAVPQIRGNVADVNLSTPQGVATLYRRLQRAAGEVCGGEPKYREFSFHAAWSRCVGASLDDAVVQVHSIGLAALHAKQVGRTTALLAAKTTPEAR